MTTPTSNRSCCADDCCTPDATMASSTTPGPDEQTIRETLRQGYAKIAVKILQVLGVLHDLCRWTPARHARGCSPPSSWL